MTKKEQTLFEKIKRLLKRFLDYLIKTMNGMALGLFSTLIIGTIIQTIGTQLGITEIVVLAKILKMLTGIGIGIGIGRSLKLSWRLLRECSTIKVLFLPIWLAIVNV